MQWCRNLAAEDFLTRHNVDWKFLDSVELSKVNRARGLKNQARLDKTLDEETVDQYARSMKNGAAFPAIVAHKANDGKYVPCDGNHRMAAYAKAGLNGTVSLYSLECDDPAIIDFVTRSGLNSINGRPLPRGEVIQQALWLLDKYPSTSISSLAKSLGLSATAIQYAIRARDVQRTLEERRIPARRFPQTALLELAKLSKDEAVMAAAADVYWERELTTAELKSMVQSANLEKSEARRHSVIEQFDNSIAQLRHSKIRKSRGPATVFLSSLSTLDATLTKYPSLAHLGITAKSEQTAAVNRVTALIEKLETML